MKLALTSFIGEAPKISPRLLPDQAAQVAQEVKVSSGSLVPLYEDNKILNFDDNIVSVYKWYLNSTDHVWLVSDTKFKVEKSPIFNDENSRIIINYFDSKETRVTDSVLANPSKNADGVTYKPLKLTKSNTYSLEVPSITSATMAVSGSGTENKESRSYAIALVREWSDGKLDVGALYAPIKTSTGALTVDVCTGQKVVISDIKVPSTAYSDAGVRKAYVYRTEVTSDGTTSYNFVASFDITSSTTTYSFTDSVAPENVAESAVSLEWDVPPPMRDIISLGNGVLVGYNDYDVYFSYPYQAHAWPSTYRVTVDYEIVGVGAFGNTVVVCTKGSPYLILVQDPASATVRTVNGNYPCLSASSILSTANGVFFASSGGLVLINSTSPKYYTEDLLTKDEWPRFNPEYLSASSYQDNYVGVSNTEDVYSGFMIHTTDPSSGIIELSRNARFVYSDPQDNSLYFIQNDGMSTQLVKYDAPSGTSDERFRSFRWKSKKFISSEGLNTLSCVRVKAEYGISLIRDTVEYVDVDAPINADTLNTGYINHAVNINTVYSELKDGNAVLFTYYVDGVAKFTKLIYSSDPVRLPSGFRGHEIEIEVIASIPVYSVELASSMGELL